MGNRLILRTTLAFAVAGPFIGAALVFLWVLLASMVRGTTPTLRDFTTTLPAVLSYGYVFGLTPAIAVGLSWSFLTRSRTFRPLLRVVWGALLGVFFGTVAGLVWDAMSGGEAGFVTLGAPCGLLAGAILCRMLPRQRGPMAL
jgi:hypothetical protein